MAHDVFISHSSKDKAIADAICARLEGAGVRCWIAPRDIIAGTEWTAAIMEAIRGSRIMVLVFSNHANESSQVQREVQQAFQKELLVIPFRIDGVVASDQLGYYLSGVHWLDAMTPPMERHLDDLLKLIKSVLTGAASQGDKASAHAPAVVRPAGRYRGLIAAAAAIGVAGLLFLGYWLRPTHNRAERAPEQAGQGATQAVPGGVAGQAAHLGNPSATTEAASGPANDPQSLLAVAQGGDVAAMRRLGRMYADGKGVDRDYLAAMKWSSAAAEKGDTDAMCDVGTLYAEGHGTARDFGKALEWYQRAAGLGDARGMRDVGQAYLNGEGAEKNVQTGLDWLKKAADKGDTVSFYVIGRVYQGGKGVDQDLATAMSWYQKGVNAGEPRSIVQLGSMYESGTGVARDAAHAFALYSQGAQAGDAVGMRNLGRCFQNGWGTQVDFQQAMTWYKRAADAGDAGAENNIGGLYENGQGVAKDAAQAVAHYQKAASGGEPAGMYNLGRCMIAGTGVAVDVRGGMRMYRQAADLGYTAATQALLRDTEMTFNQDQEDIYARINLAIHYLHPGPDEDPARGLGFLTGLKRRENQDFSATFVELLAEARNNDPDAMAALGLYYTSDDLTSAHTWFSKAADLGQPVAMDYLGVMYSRGDVVDQNNATALQWYQKAANTGSAAAMDQLGLIYQQGKITPKDDKLAMKWITDAAESGFVAAMRELGDIYSKGTGVPVDAVQARKWYQKAAAAGDADARNWLTAHPEK